MRLPIPFCFDDFVLDVIATTPEELIPKCARVLEKHVFCFASRGMEVNDNVGKTEAFLQCNGTGVAKVREALGSGTQKMGTEHPVFGCLNIGITQQYKHLGSMNAGPHKFDQEIESRVGQVRTTNKALRRKLFANKGPPRKDRRTAWKALTFSNLCFAQQHGGRSP